MSERYGRFHLEGNNRSRPCSYLYRTPRVQQGTLRHREGHNHGSKTGYHGSKAAFGRLVWLMGPSRDGTYLAVDLVFGDVKLANHTEGDGTTAGLGVVHLAFKDDSVDSLFLGKDLGGAGTGGASPHDGNLVLHAERAGGRSRDSSHRLAGKGRGRKGRSGSDKRRDGDKGELHL